MQSDILNDYTFESVSCGMTYKAKMPEGGRRLYLIVNYNKAGEPFEVFARYDEPEHFELITTLTRQISMSLRQGVSLSVIAKDLQDIHSPVTHHIIPGTDITCPSLAARVGYMLEEHLKLINQKEVA